MKNKFFQLSIMILIASLLLSACGTVTSLLPLRLGAKQKASTSALAEKSQPQKAAQSEKAAGSNTATH